MKLNRHIKLLAFSFVNGVLFKQSYENISQTITTLFQIFRNNGNYISQSLCLIVQLKAEIFYLGWKRNGFQLLNCFCIFSIVPPMNSTLLNLLAFAFKLFIKCFIYDSIFIYLKANYLLLSSRKTLYDFSILIREVYLLSELDDPKWLAVTSSKAVEGSNMDSSQRGLLLSKFDDCSPPITGDINICQSLGKTIVTSSPPEEE